MSPVTAAIAASYQQFSRVEAAGRSWVYADLARRVSRDDRCLNFLAALPAEKRQPNLLFGAVQLLGGPTVNWNGFRSVLDTRTEDVARVMLAHRTQTNIPARCATLLPALAALPGPLALIEVGASAGLCLYPDRYGYDFSGDFGDLRIEPTPGAPRFHCTVDGPAPVPSKPVEVVWRAGLDLNPLDVADPEHVAWLDALVWPGEEHLGHQLHAAIEVLRADPPLLVTGDLRTDVRRLLAKAPPDATPVVFHTAVLSYLTDPADRARFAATMAASGAVWLANEAPERIPDLPAEVAELLLPGEFVLCRDGVPLAATDPHGASLRWF